MTLEETQNWIREVSARFPGIRARLFHADADAKNIAIDWAIALDKITPETATKFTQAMVAGDPEPPQYGDDWARLPAMLRQWSKQNQPLVCNVAASAFSEQQSYRCIACWDRGYGVVVFNPSWVNAHELECERGLSGAWEAEARRWCKTKGAGSFTYACDCSCEVGRRQQEARRIRRQVYMPAVHCLVPLRSQWESSLAKWVVEHPSLDQPQHQWQPELTQA